MRMLEPSRPRQQLDENPKHALYKVPLTDCPMWMRVRARVSCSSTCPLLSIDFVSGVELNEWSGSEELASSSHLALVFHDTYENGMIDRRYPSEKGTARTNDPSSSSLAGMQSLGRSREIPPAKR